MFNILLVILGICIFFGLLYLSYVVFCYASFFGSVYSEEIKKRLHKEQSASKKYQA